MILNQQNLIKEVAKKENLKVATVQKIFKSVEDVIFEYLSSIPSSENVIIKLFSGIILHREYVKKKKYSRGMFHDIDCKAHVTIKPKISKHYVKKINDKLF